VHGLRDRRGRGPLADPAARCRAGRRRVYLMAQEIVTAIAERIKPDIVIVQNHGFASIGRRRVGRPQRFGTACYRNLQTGLLDGDLPSTWLPTRPAWAPTCCAPDHPGAAGPPRAARAATVTTVVHIETDRWPPPRRPVRGGTCRWHRPPCWTAPGRRTPPTRPPSTASVRTSEPLTGKAPRVMHLLAASRWTRPWAGIGAEAGGQP
jgi:3D-(3,5/4)-trihydroxycyclohexane-1,2-dione acylhydrolase (decyclizing)